MKVVDLTTGIAGAYCTKVLSDLGYEVVKTHAPDDNALMQFLARNKRIDPDFDLAQARVLVMDSREMFDRTSQLAGAGAVVTIITPFGLGTPWSDNPVNEFTLQAWSGAMIGLGRGFPDRAPVQVGGNVGAFMAGLYGAIGAMVSLARGGAEIVDVSMLESLALCLTYYPVTYFDMVGRPFRSGRAPVTPGVESAKDGLVGLGVGTGQQWLDFCVMVGHPEWQEDRKLFANRAHLAPVIAEWMAERTVDEILELASAFRIPHAPIGNGETIAKTEAFLARGSIVDGVPAPPWRFSNPPTASAPVSFETLRVVDLTAFWAGPLTTHALGMLGAEVIHIESTTRPDGTRMLAGKRFSEPDWWEYSGVFAGLNTNKKSLTLDLQTARGRELLQQLIDTADVVVENFTPRVMDQLGLDFSRPDLITVRMPGFGLDGPWRDNPAFAFVIEDASGLTWRTGYPDRNPLSPYSLGDPNAGLHALAGLLRALEHRAATGEGTLVEAAMIDAALNVAVEQIVEHRASGTVLQRTGNQSPDAIVQGLFAAKGDDVWVAISARTSEHVAALNKLTDDNVVIWCASREPAEIVEQLWAVGVPVGVVVQPHMQPTLPPFQSRRFFETLTHPIAGDARHSTLPIRFSNGPAQFHRRHAPLLGEHNDEILLGLGLSNDEIAALETDGVIGRAPFASFCPVTRGLSYDPVEASREIWVEQGWGEVAGGMAAVVSIIRAEQIFLNEATDILRPLGLTFARYQVLGMLRWTGPLTLGKLGNRLWITPATVTNAIDRLEKAELCRRESHPDDARATLAQITPKGSKLFDRAVEQLNDQLFGKVGLSEKELSDVVRLVRKIRAGAGDTVADS